MLAFAGRGSRCTPAFRVARVQPAGAPGDVFTTSAVGWGHSILASVEYSDARRAFNEAVAGVAAIADAADAARMAEGIRSTSGWSPRPGCGSTR